MNSYLIDIKLNNGDEVKARSLGCNPQDAQNRVTESNQFKEFSKGLEIVSIHTELEEEAITIDATRYDLQPSKEREGWYVATDKKSLVVIVFEKGKFNETHRVTRLGDTAIDPLTAATELKNIADYLQLYHPDVL